MLLSQIHNTMKQVIQIQIQINNLKVQSEHDTDCWHGDGHQSSCSPLTVKPLKDHVNGSA